MPTVEEIRQQILISDTFVLAEVEKLQYLYGLQKIIRSNLTRPEKIETNSVAEHIYALGVLATYFSALEDPGHQLNMTKVQSLILWHDVDEIETGDVVGFLKTEQDKQNAEIALDTVLSKVPIVLKKHIHDVLIEYKEQSTLEARFVKALDKLEPTVYFLNQNGKKVFEVSPATKEQHCRIKEPYVKNFPYMYRFYLVTLEVFEREGYFAHSI